MHFEVEHFFDAPIEIVEAAIFNPDYVGFLVEHSDLLTSVSVQSFEDDGASLRRRVQLSPRPAFDRIGTKKIPPEWFVFTEQSTWSRRDRRLSFENVPKAPEVARRVINRGEVSLEVLSAGRTRRCTRGEIKVHNLPLLARPLIPLIEQMLVREARRMLDGEAEALRSWLLKPTAQPSRDLQV
jgi:hypothetical protein